MGFNFHTIFSHFTYYSIPFSSLSIHYHISISSSCSLLTYSFEAAQILIFLQFCSVLYIVCFTIAIFYNYIHTIFLIHSINCVHLKFIYYILQNKIIRSRRRQRHKREYNFLLLLCGFALFCINICVH
jgi:hypothetical protein